MEISLDQIHAYLNCPMKCKLEYKDKLKGKEPKSVLFKKAVHQCISFFFFTAWNGYIPTPAQMKDKWAATWEELGNVHSSIADLLTVRDSLRIRENRPKDREHEKMKMAGFEMVHNFYNFNKNNPGNVIGVDLDYRVPIGDAIVTGKFELVREIVDSNDGKRYIEIVDFKTNSDEIDPFLVKNDLNLTIASYAFRNLFKPAKEDRVKYHYLKTGRDIIIVKQESDFKRMAATVNGVHNSIQNELFYPRQNFMCKSCEVKDICDRVRF